MYFSAAHFSGGWICKGLHHDIGVEEVGGDNVGAEMIQNIEYSINIIMIYYV